MQGVIGGPSVTFNPYPYAQNNPVNMVDPNGEFPWLAAIWAATKVAGLVTGGAFAIDAGNQVRANLYSGMSLGDAIAGVDGWGSLRRSAEWGVSAGIGHITGAYTTARVTHGLMTAGRAAMINNTIDIGTGFFWETVVNRNGAGSAAFNAVAGSTFGGILGASGKGAGWMLGRLGAGADWVGRQMNWSPRWALPNGYNLPGSLILQMSKRRDDGRQRVLHGFERYRQLRLFDDIRLGDLDYLGRPTGVTANLGSPLREGTVPSVDPTGWRGSQGNVWQRGHLLGKALGGTGDDIRNLAPLRGTSNRFMYHEFEKNVINAIDKGQIVNYVITPLYRNDDLIPFAIELYARGSGSDPFEQALTILNPLPD